jgi:hypothetical protein
LNDNGQRSSPVVITPPRPNHPGPQRPTLAAAATPAAHAIIPRNRQTARTANHRMGEPRTNAVDILGAFAFRSASSSRRRVNPAPRRRTFREESKLLAASSTPSSPSRRPSPVYLASALRSPLLYPCQHTKEPGISAMRTYPGYDPTPLRRPSPPCVPPALYIYAPTSIARVRLSRSTI